MYTWPCHAPPHARDISISHEISPNQHWLYCRISRQDYCLPCHSTHVIIHKDIMHGLEPGLVAHMQVIENTLAWMHKVQGQQVFRARFSAITAPDIRAAMVQPCLHDVLSQSAELRLLAYWQTEALPAHTCTMPRQHDV